MAKKKPILMIKLKNRILQSTNCLRIWPTWPISPKPPSSTIYLNVMSDFWSTPILVSSVSLSIPTNGFQYMTITLLVVTRARESLKCLHISSPFLIMLTMTCWENVTINLCWLLVSFKISRSWVRDFWMIRTRSRTWTKSEISDSDAFCPYYHESLLNINIRWIWCW